VGEEVKAIRVGEVIEFTDAKTSLDFVRPSEVSSHPQQTAIRDRLNPPRVTRTARKYGECGGGAIVYDAISIDGGVVPVAGAIARVSPNTRVACARSSNSLARTRRSISWVGANYGDTRGAREQETSVGVRGRAGWLAVRRCQRGR
jgi:hypothetical protein